MTEGSTAKTVTVALTARETITERGTRKATWFVYWEQQWQSVRECPGVELSRLDPGPGTIWESVAELKLQVGTWLQRVESTPTKKHHTDPLHYLHADAKALRRRVARTFYRVAADGSIARPERGLLPP